MTSPRELHQGTQGIVRGLAAASRGVEGIRRRRDERKDRRTREKSEARQAKIENLRIGQIEKMGPLEFDLLKERIADIERNRKFEDQDRATAASDRERSIAIQDEERGFRVEDRAARQRLDKLKIGQLEKLGPKELELLEARINEMKSQSEFNRARAGESLADGRGEGTAGLAQEDAEIVSGLLRLLVDRRAGTDATVETVDDLMNSLVEEAIENGAQTSADVGSYVGSQISKDLTLLVQGGGFEGGNLPAGMKEFLLSNQEGLVHAFTGGAEISMEDRLGGVETVDEQEDAQAMQRNEARELQKARKTSRARRSEARLGEGAASLRERGGFGNRVAAGLLEAGSQERLRRRVERPSGIPRGSIAGGQVPTAMAQRARDRELTARMLQGIGGFFSDTFGRSTPQPRQVTPQTPLTSDEIIQILDRRRRGQQSPTLQDIINQMGAQQSPLLQGGGVQPQQLQERQPVDLESLIRTLR